MSNVLLSAFLSLYACVNAQTVDDEFPGKITCYGYRGREFTNNTQCPGSRICCNTVDQCDPNRFCRKDDQIVVPPCSRFPWDNCANICLYDPGNGFLPRAIECDDGSFCCDNDPRCCTENRGIVLNGLGAVVTTNSGPTSTTEPATTSTSAASSVQDEAAATPAESTTSGNQAAGDKMSAGAKAGVGVGAAVAVVALVSIAFWCCWRRKRGATKRRSDTVQEVAKTSLVRSYTRQELDGGSNNRQDGSFAAGHELNKTHLGASSEVSADMLSMGSANTVRQRQDHVHELSS